MSIFSRFNKGNSDLSSFDISFHYHDPEREEIVVYNNGKGSKGPVKVVVMNEKKQQFEHDFDKIASRIGVLLHLAQVRDKNNLPFTGKLEQVQIHYFGQKLVFFPEGNKFKPGK